MACEHEAAQTDAGKLLEYRRWLGDAITAKGLYSTADDYVESSNTAKRRTNITGNAQTSQDDKVAHSSGEEAGMNGFVPVVTQEEFSRTKDEDDEGQSDTSEDIYEAWSAYRSPNWGGSLSEDDTDYNLNSSSSGTQPYYQYEQEDWDAEMLALEEPYDEEDLVEIACKEHINLCGYKSVTEGSYNPSLHHVPPLEWSNVINLGAFNTESGQFEDAEQ
ncbi:coordinator of PRMT5 and differentiation stimulator isoform X2 [Pseudophryne corroboree]|uniref:coordinator of PRMT5 and differentiation stimulator isoform X2 n=1 Tax=Pseudophryne corroboree TaxID=495146 RepID=UPI0030817D06